jgi:sodium-dependent dicarboxylate transporter 2/3/5
LGSGKRLFLSVLIAIAASCAFMLPVATPQTHRFRHRPYQAAGDDARGLFLNVACIVVLTGFSMLFWV